MVTKTITKQPKAVTEVQITVPWTDVAAKWDQTLQRMAQDVELPGFRKGQAPLPMVEQSLGQKLTDEFFKIIFPESLVQALQGSNVVPIDYPKYQLISFVKGQTITFKAILTERPAVKVGDYKTLKVQRPAVKAVADEQVDQVIADLFRRWKVRQPAQTNNSNQPVSGTSGSMSFNGQTQAGGLVNASGQPISTSTDQPDDNFARAIGAQSLPDLKTKVRTDLENEAKYNNELDFEEAILQKVESLTETEIPEVLVEDELNRMLVSLQRRVADMGLLLEDYLKGQGKTLEGIKTEWRPQAEKNVRMELGLAEIGRMEEIDVSDEELQAEIDKIQDARLKAQFEAQEPRLHLRHSMRQVKTLDTLKKLIHTA
ncbi:hypothetical protein M1563_04755 [Patescibacteria group bacterium]|nr:hypothetical protein [Patescibacteria group bacterium]